MSKKKKMLKSLAMILTTITTLKTIEAKEITRESILEEAKEEAENGNVEIGVTTYTREENKSIKKQTQKAIDIKLRDIVTVNGRGTSSSDGTGNQTIRYENDLMAVVGVKKESPFPYALAKIKEDGSLDDVIGWFKKKNIIAKIEVIKTTDFAPIKKEIVDIKDVAIEMEVKTDYDTFTIKNLPDFKEAHIYQKEDQECAYYCDRLDGSYWYFTEKRVKVKEDKKVLQKRYGIKNS